MDAMNGMADVDAMDDGVVEGTADGPGVGRPSQRCLHRIIDKYLEYLFCIGNLSRQSGLALGKERCEQPCLKWHGCLFANGLHLSLHDVKYGACEGALP